MNENEKDQLLLTQLVLMFQTAALQQMGKLKNPVTDRIERDLGQAQISIDILDVLHRKMKSSLTTEENRLFSGVLRELRLNYVDEAGKPASTGSSDVQTGASHDPSGSTPPPAGG